MVRKFRLPLFQRIIFILFFVIIYYKIDFLLLYISLFYISFEILNFNKNYKRLEKKELYNFFFIFSAGFVIAIRSKFFLFSESVTYSINTLEHLLFAMVLCTLISLYLNLFKISFKNKIIRISFIAILFNVLGLINEFYQNYLMGNEMFQLEDYSIKDLWVNVSGTFLYIVSSIISDKRK